MNIKPTYLAGALLVVIVLSALPLPDGLHIALGVLAALLAAALVGVLLFVEKQGASAAPAAKEEPRRPGAGEPPVATGSAEAEVIAFLGLMQEKGRLIDFLMDDISGYKDEEVGQAARVVYEGCRSVVREHLSIEPLLAEEEGSKVTVPEGYRTADYQLSGKLTGEAPFKGTLVHPGWKVTSAKLPKVVRPEDGKLPNLAPAQVELDGNG